jgi:hypothetical protein
VGRDATIKRVYWLRWDGVPAAIGSQNGGVPPEPGPRVPVDAQRARQREIVDALARAGDGVEARSDVSVRLKDFSGRRDAKGSIWIPVQLKNPDEVAALVLRVHDPGGRPIYHELIDRPAECLRELRPAELQRANDVRAGERDDTGFRVVVWVTQQREFLARLGIDDALDSGDNVYMVTVSNEYDPSPEEVATKRTARGKAPDDGVQRAAKRKAGKYRPRFVYPDRRPE